MKSGYNLRYDVEQTDASLSQTVHTTPGVEYDFSFQFKVDNTSENRNVGFVCYIGNLAIGQYAAQVAMADAGKWLTRTVKYTAIGDVSSLQCSLTSPSHEFNSIAIDEISLSCSS
jgi:hypothetical protein